ncbi:MAG: hypothetical protein AB7O52_15175 [Planctomycetota bacterium]
MLRSVATRPVCQFALAALCLVLQLPRSLHAQEVVPPPLPTPVEKDSPQRALETMSEAIAAKENELREAELALDQAGRTARREPLTAEVARLRQELAAQRAKFTSLSAQVDLGQLLDPSEEAFDLRNELTTLLRPLVQQLKEVTAEPRQIEQLRSQVALYEQRLAQARRALQNLDRLIPGVDPTSALAERLRQERASWREREETYDASRRIAGLELEQKLGERKSLIESTGSFFNGFFRSRGLNLLLAGSSFFAALLILRFARHRALKLIFRRRPSFYSRLAGVVLHVLSVLIALLVMLMVLFTVSDWVLLVIVLIFLVGAGWASVNMLPQFFEQVRTLLNLGTVREGERVVFEGLPWRVDALKIYTVLRNPDLTGGEYRIPVQNLAGFHSRPLGDNEVWFPSRQGDWVLLGDSTFGQVLHQSPDSVQVGVPGGAVQTYPTRAFLDASPRNLSGGYRLKVTFGIDYAHQAVCTTEVPRLMQAKLTTELAKLVDETEVRRVVVEFKAAGASSLDYDVLVDLGGTSAGKYLVLQRAVSRILVDACNEHRWVIPFAQVVVHRAPE